MTQAKRTYARTLILAAGTAGFVALGAGVSGAEGLEAPVREITPIVERALVEGVAPTMNSLAPEGVEPVADSALSELQQTAKDPRKPAPELAAPLPRSENLNTPVGEVDTPTGTVADTVARTQDSTGLDGDPYDTVGHSAGTVLQSSAEETGTVVEDLARGTGTEVENAATELLPHTVEATHGLEDELDVPEPAELTGVAQSAELPEPSSLTDLTGDNSLAADEATSLVGTDSLLSAAPSQNTVPQSAAEPTVPNLWDMAYVFGLETPKRAQDLVESNPVTDDNYVSLGEDEILGMVGQRNFDESLTTVHQSSPRAPGLSDLTGALTDVLATADGVEPVAVDGALADTELPDVTDTTDTAEVTPGGLPKLAEGADTQSAEDLVSELSRGTGLLDDLDTSDLLSIEGGTAEQAPAAGDGLTHHPTFTELPGSEALPAVS